MTTLLQSQSVSKLTVANDDKQSSPFSFVPSQESGTIIFASLAWFFFGQYAIAALTFGMALIGAALGSGIPAAVAVVLYYTATLLISWFFVYRVARILYWDRWKWHDIQRNANSFFSRRFHVQGSLPAFVLYFRPFESRGKFKVPNFCSKLSQRILLGLKWDVELALSVTFDPKLTVIAIGDERKSEFGAAKILTNDEAWKNVAHHLIRNSTMVVMVPFDTPGVEWELNAIAADAAALDRTIFVMPPSNLWRSYKGTWDLLATKLHADHELLLPNYRRAGGLFKLSAEGHTELLPFRTLQQKYSNELLAACDVSSDEISRKDAWAYLSKHHKQFDLLMHTLPVFVERFVDRTLALWLYFVTTVAPLLIAYELLRAII